MVSAKEKLEQIEAKSLQENEKVKYDELVASGSSHFDAMETVRALRLKSIAQSQ